MYELCFVELTRASSYVTGGRMIDFTLPEKAKILNVHNKLRNSLATGKVPGFNSAVRMGTMTWDDELAAMADLNIRRCTYGRDCHNTPNYPFSGQNLASKPQSISTFILTFKSLKSSTVICSLLSLNSHLIFLTFSMLSSGHYIHKTYIAHMIRVICPSQRFSEWNRQSTKISFSICFQIWKILQRSR